MRIPTVFYDFRKSCLITLGCAKSKFFFFFQCGLGKITLIVHFHKIVADQSGLRNVAQLMPSQIS